MTWEQIELFEEWRQVIGYEGLYEVSNWGRVRSVAGVGWGNNKTGRIQKLAKKKTDYLEATLYKNRKRQWVLAHRLVAAAFIGPCPNGKEVDHLDGDRTNNTVLNLRYLTRQENIQCGARAKLTPDNVIEIRRLVLEGFQQNDLAKKYGVHVQTIYRLMKKTHWDNIKKKD